MVNIRCAEWVGKAGHRELSFTATRPHAWDGTLSGLLGRPQGVPTARLEKLTCMLAKGKGSLVRPNVPAILLRG